MGEDFVKVKVSIELGVESYSKAMRVLDEEDLTVETLSRQFFISRYYLMHRFKALTGYSVHQYISQKRVLRSAELIRSGVPVMKAAEQAGFREYTAFLRAFRSAFHMSPREFR